MASTLYSNNASDGDLWNPTSAGMVEDMAEVMANLNFLEGKAGYPLTTWADPSGSYSEYMTLRCVITGSDIPGSGDYITDAINRIRVQYFGIDAVSSWGFDPSDTVNHIVMRNGLQHGIGAPMNVYGLQAINYTYADEGGGFYGLSVSQSAPHGTVLDYLPLGRWFLYTKGVQIDDTESGSGLEMDTQFIITEATSVTTEPTGDPIVPYLAYYLNFDPDDLPASPEDFDYTSDYWSTSDSTAMKVIDITSIVSAWIATGPTKNLYFAQITDEHITSPPVMETTYGIQDGATQMWIWGIDS